MASASASSSSASSSSSTAAAGGAAGPKAAGGGAGGGGPGAVQRRLQQELMTLMTSGSKGVTAFPDGDSMFEWVGTISGCDGTPYAGLQFKLKLRFPPDYVRARAARGARGGQGAVCVRDRERATARN